VSDPLVQALGLSRTYRRPRRLWSRRTEVQALDDVDLIVEPGVALGLVGTSGSGKSTLARCLARLEEPSAGDVRFRGQSLRGLNGAALRSFRRQVQLVFQDPATALNPRFTALEIVTEPLLILQVDDRTGRRRRAREWIERVGLSPREEDRRPLELSGGQRQRLALARALVVDPLLLILDEALSELDASLRAQMIALLLEIQGERELTCLHISHDLGLMRHVADEVVVLHRGRVVERGGVGELLVHPRHPRTEALVAAIPPGVTLAGARPGA